MKIVEVIPHLVRKAGGEALFVDLCLSLKTKFGVDVKVVALFDNINDVFKKQFESAGIEYVSLGKKEGFDYKCAKKFRATINKINPDIVHTHLNSLVTYYLAFGKKKRKWKLFHTVHLVAKFDNNRFGKLFSKILLKRKLLTNIAISNQIQKSIFDVYSEKYNVPVIYNGVKLRKYDDNKKDYDFVNVARFDEAKNHSFFLDCIFQYKKINRNVKVAFVGGGSLLEEMKKKAHRLELDDNVVFSGFTFDVPDFLSKSKVFILPSLLEGNPISILEAMNAGLPIIAANVGGIPDVIKDGVNGLLVNPKDHSGVVSAMDKVLKDDGLRSNMSKRNIADVEKYSIENCAFEYFTLFKNNINGDVR